jgi:hypothetical protein
METQTVQGIAEDEAAWQICVVEGLDSELIACAKQLFAGPIPNGKSEIAE